MLLARALVVSIGSLVVVACAAPPSEPTIGSRSESSSGSSLDPDPPPRVVPTAATHAVDAIVDARCDREVTCGHVDIGRTYDSRAECRAEIAEAWAEELAPYDCPGGLDHAELADCLEAIRNEDCGEPFETLGRLLACRSSDVCEPS